MERLSQNCYEEPRHGDTNGTNCQEWQMCLQLYRLAFSKLQSMTKVLRFSSEFLLCFLDKATWCWVCWMYCPIPLQKHDFYLFELSKVSIISIRQYTSMYNILSDHRLLTQQIPKEHFQFLFSLIISYRWPGCFNPPQIIQVQ